MKTSCSTSWVLLFLPVLALYKGIDQFWCKKNLQMSASEKETSYCKIKQVCYMWLCRMPIKTSRNLRLGLLGINCFYVIVHKVFVGNEHVSIIWCPPLTVKKKKKHIPEHWNTFWKDIKFTSLRVKILVVLCAICTGCNCILIKTCKTNCAIPFPEYNDKWNAYKGTGNDINNTPCKNSRISLLGHFMDQKTRNKLLSQY